MKTHGNLNKKNYSLFVLKISFVVFQKIRITHLTLRIFFYIVITMKMVFNFLLFILCMVYLVPLHLLAILVALWKWDWMVMEKYYHHIKIALYPVSGFVIEDSE